MGFDLVFMVQFCFDLLICVRTPPWGDAVCQNGDNTGPETFDCSSILIELLKAFGELSLVLGNDLTMS